jgi:hypothetical protein
MPDLTITAPVAADPIDRLILGATDVRDAARNCTTSVPNQGMCYCMAEE